MSWACAVDGTAASANVITNKAAATVGQSMSRSLPQADARVSLAPSPGTPGGGWGEGDGERRATPDGRIHPHPSLLPAYREKGPELMRVALLTGPRAGSSPGARRTDYETLRPPENCRAAG